MSVQDELFATSVGTYAHLVSDLGVHRDIYVDPGVFEAELKRIFGRVWVYVAHESEVPRPGDFKTSWIGRQLRQRQSRRRERRGFGCVA